MNQDSTYVDGLLPVLQKLAKSDICSTIIPGRLYPTRTSHGKVLELRVCCQSNSNDINDCTNDLSANNRSDHFNSIPTSSRKSINDKSFDSIRSVKNIIDKNNSKEGKTLSNNSSSSSNNNNNNNRNNVNNHNISSSNSNTNSSSSLTTKVHGSNNKNINGVLSSSYGNNFTSSLTGKSSHRVLARNGSLVQEVHPCQS